MEGWNDLGNHDSRREPRDIVALINQIKLLPGIATQNYTGVPSTIALFSRLCLYGERTIYIVKGIHQRWGNNPKPHIRIRFFYSVGPSGKQESTDMHVELSEEPSRWKEDSYSWKTVGISYIVGQNTKQTWPAAYQQEVGNIQSESGPRRRRLLRRMSVGCFPPPVVAPNPGVEPVAVG
ncbi:MAG TPA: hypothetical protein VGM42_12205 [Rhodopila sp.]